MTRAKQLAQYDIARSAFLAESVLTTGKEDFFGKDIIKVGRRYVWQFSRFNDHGAQVSSHMYVSEVCKALKSGALSVYIK